MWRLGSYAMVLVGCTYSPQPVTGDDDGEPTPTPQCTSNDWLDPAWQNRSAIAIDHSKVAGDLTGFPVLVDFQATGSTGADLVFTTADGTRLDHELDAIDGDRVRAWVRIPTLSSTTDTLIYAYYGNPAAADQAAPTEVWQDDYLAVYHLGGSPAAQLVESSHGLDATARGNMTAQAVSTGKIGASLVFDGNDDALDTPSITLPATFTYEAWVSKHATGAWKCIIDNQGYDRWFGVTDDSLSFWDGGSNIVSNPMTADTWTYLVATYDGTTVRIYNGGQPIGGIGKNFDARTGPMLIGYSNTTVKEYFPGKIDEVRISSVARSPEYVATAFANQDRPTTFAVAGEPETCE